MHNTHTLFRLLLLAESVSVDRDNFFAYGTKHAAEPRDRSCRSRAPERVGVRVRVRIRVRVVLSYPRYCLVPDMGFFYQPLLYY